jgi:TRAP-type C4-dicarboxylate transport system permease small subunit
METLSMLFVSVFLFLFGYVHMIWYKLNKKRINEAVALARKSNDEKDNQKDLMFAVFMFICSGIYFLIFIEKIIKNYF